MVMWLNCSGLSPEGSDAASFAGDGRSKVEGEG